jgi:predicted amidohydrolase
MNRRQFLRAAAGFPVVLASRRSLSAAEYDLVTLGGRVIDPSQHMDRIADVAIRGGRIAAIRNQISPSAAADTIDARGMIVMPGLIDIHLHARDAALPPSAQRRDSTKTDMDRSSS